MPKSLFSTEKLLNLLCSKLRLSNDVETEANKIALKLPTLSFSEGRTQVSLAAAAIYAASQASNAPKTAKEIENESEVKELVILQKGI